MTTATSSSTARVFEHGGKLAGIFTVLGFDLSLVVVLLEKA
jgi:hypothetical protein